MVGAAPQLGILERLLGPQSEPLSRDVARFFLGVTFTDVELRRIAELSEKANEGELSAEERDELLSYVLLKDFLTILHSHAREALHSPAAPVE